MVRNGDFLDDFVLGLPWHICWLIMPFVFRLSCGLSAR